MPACAHLQTLTPSKYCMHATVRDRALQQCDHGSARHLLSTLLGPAAADALGVIRAARGAGPVLAPENARCVGLTACSATMAAGERARQLRGHTATTRRICDFKAREHTRSRRVFQPVFPRFFLPGWRVKRCTQPSATLHGCLNILLSNCVLESGVVVRDRTGDPLPQAGTS
jgi:hypothetical protein